MCGKGKHQSAGPPKQLLDWAAKSVRPGSEVVWVRSLQSDQGPWLLRIDHGSGEQMAVLRIPGRVEADQIVVGAAALQVAEEHGLDAPRLIAKDLDGRTAGSPATLETALPGSSASPSKASVARLRDGGAALARVHAVRLPPCPDLPVRHRSCDVDDWALERRWATLHRATPEDERPAVARALGELTGWPSREVRRALAGPRSSPLLQLADERLREVPPPTGGSVFVHGDVWAGNMLWDGDTCIALIDWKSAGVGDPGVDLGNLRMKMAVQYGADAPDHVLEGWQEQSGQAPTNMAYWDLVACVYSPAVLDDYESGFDDHGREIDWTAKTRRRDAFLRDALQRLNSTGNQ